MGAIEAVRAEGLPLLDDMTGHPGMARYQDEGFKIITFWKDDLALIEMPIFRSSPICLSERPLKLGIPERISDIFFTKYLLFKNYPLFLTYVKETTSVIMLISI